MEKENLKTKAKVFWDENKSNILFGCQIMLGAYIYGQIRYTAGYLTCLANVMEAIDENSAN